MRSAAILLFGWLVPGGTYLVRRRYWQFALFFFAVALAFCAGVALHGGLSWPGPEELAGTDGLTIMMARGGTLAKMLAGGPYLLATSLGHAQTFVGGRVHEYGTVLLDVAGLLNLLAITDALEREAR